MTVFVILFRGAPTAAAPDLVTAQTHALAERTAPASASPYENGWVEKGPGEWRLMTRRRDRGGRWSWTQRAVRAVPLIHGEQPAPVERAAVLRETASLLVDHASVLEALSSSDYDNEMFAASHLRTKAVDLHRLADKAQQPAAGSPAEVSAADFYQPGHTYTSGRFPQYGWKFRCDTVITHPEDSERTALGWRFFHGKWEPYAYGEDDWDVHNFREDGLVDEGTAPHAAEEPTR
ncbi:hypothetical protein ACFCV8_00820 [Streptomyces sp. NPDC056347]|uniref:hypothetical protein n=1 Tax=Streptomyces sp. NPDC056347 TaxID=3345790 RepID=UPI0035E1AB6F